MTWVGSYDYLRKLSKRQAPLTERGSTLTNIVEATAPEPCYPLAVEPWRYNDVDVRHRALPGGSRRREGSGAGPTGSPTPEFREDASRAGAENWLALKNHHAPGASAISLARSLIARLALQRVMSENGIDAFVHPENTVPTPKIQGPNVGQISLEGITPFLQILHVVVPAGTTDVVYEPRYWAERDEDRLRVGTCAEHSENHAVAPNADRDYVLRRAGWLIEVLKGSA